MYNEDTQCIRKLSSASKQVLEEGSFIGRETMEKRLGLWNEIRQNKDRFISGECGTLINDIDRHFRGVFDVSLLILASSFIENDEDVSAAKRMFAPEELEAYYALEKFRSVEIYSESELKARLIRKDRGVLDLFRQYFLFGDEKLEEIIGSPEIRNSLKYYFNRKWGELTKKINKAASSLIMEVDYLGLLIRYWEDESRRIADVSGSNARQKALDEVQTRESDILDRLLIKEEEVSFYQEKVVSQDELIKSLFDKTDRNSEANSRYVTSGEAKQYELNFIERMNQKFSVEISLDKRRYSIKEKSEENSISAPKFRALSSFNNSDCRSFPLNRFLRVHLTEKKLLGRKSNYMAFMAYCCRLDILAENAFDSEPLGLREINVALDDMLRYGKEHRSRVLLCLASPTGFDKQSLSYIDSDTFFRNFSSQRLSICLLDLVKNETYYNRNDSVAEEFAGLCNPELPLEMMQRVRDEVNTIVNDLLSVNSWAELNDVQEKSSEDLELIKQFFYRFADENGYTIRFVQDVGLVMMK